MISFDLRLACPVLYLMLAACEGDGSDIGPKLDTLPNASSKVLVLDDTGRGVAGASVAVVGVDVPDFARVTGRSGRADLLTGLSGSHEFVIGGSAASATDSDRLVSLRFRANMSGQDLPFAVYLPDTSTSGVETVATGVALPAPVVVPIDPAAPADTDAELELAGGTIVFDDLAGDVSLRMGELQYFHLPGELPTVNAGTQLFTNAFYVDPPTATFTPGATLEVSDQLGLPAGGVAQLWHLDNLTGEWVLVAGGASSAAGRLALTNGVERGGLYVYAVAATGFTVVTGRVVDEEARSVSNVLVRVGASRTVASGDGSFTVPRVPSTLADGSARDVVVDLRGGGGWLPVGVSPLPVLGVSTSTQGSVNLGDVVLDTVRAGNIRVQLVDEGRTEPLRNFAVSSADVLMAAGTLTDELGQCWFEDVPQGYFGFDGGFPFDSDEVFIVEALGFFPGGLRWLDLYAFYDDRAWFVGSRNTRAAVLDSVGGGPVRDAVVVSGSTDGEGYSGLTQEAGVVFVGRDFGNRATAVMQTSTGGETVTSAFTIQDPDSERLEMPVVRALRSPGGEFDRYGMASGDFTGFDPAAEQQFRASRMLEFTEWFDAVMLGVPPQTSVPIKTGLPQGSYRAGVAVPYGSLAVAEGTTSGSVFTLDRLGIASMLAFPEGAETARDLPLDHVAGTIFPVNDLTVGLDPVFGAADLRFDLGLRLLNGLVADVARDVGGNVTLNNELVLPALDGDLLGGTWAVAIGAETVGSSSVEQRVFFELNPLLPAPTAPQLALPTMTSPLHNATVSASGFDVAFTLPPASTYATIELRSVDGDRIWQAVVPPDQTDFSFWKLPPEAASPLVAGIDYELSLTAFELNGTSIVSRSQFVYHDVTTFWHSIGAGQRGVRALARSSITVTTN